MNIIKDKLLYKPNKQCNLDSFHKLKIICGVWTSGTLAFWIYPSTGMHATGSVKKGQFSVEAGSTFPTMATQTFGAGSGRQKEDKRRTFLKLFTSTPGIVTKKIEKDSLQI